MRTQGKAYIVLYVYLSLPFIIKIVIKSLLSLHVYINMSCLYFAQYMGFLSTCERQCMIGLLQYAHQCMIGLLQYMHGAGHVERLDSIFVQCVGFIQSGIRVGKSDPG